MFRKFKITRGTAFILLFFIVGSVVALFTSLNHLDSNFNLDYIREIQETHGIPKYHPHIFNTAGSQIPFPYPIGYHLALSIFPHSVSLYKVLQVLFAVVSLIMTIKLAELFGVKNIAVIIPLVLAYSFSWNSITPHQDMFALMLVLISVYFTLRYIKGGKWTYALVAVVSGFWGSMSREFALVTILFANLAFLFMYKRKWLNVIYVCSGIILLTGLGYYWVNVIVRGQSILYPFVGKVDTGAWTWYGSHNSVWNILGHGYLLQSFANFVKVFWIFIPIFFLTLPRNKILAFVFGCQVVLTLVLLPSTAGLDRYVMFTFPFLSIAYANVWDKLSGKSVMGILLAGLFILYPMQGYLIQNKFPTNFEGITENLGPNDNVLFREYGQLAYRTSCKANWTSLFWSSDLFESFENVDKAENLIKKHGITHVLIDKEIILQANSSMIGNEAMGYPKEWVEKIENIGTKISETHRYLLYQVGS